MRNIFKAIKEKREQKREFITVTLEETLNEIQENQKKNIQELKEFCIQNELRIQRMAKEVGDETIFNESLDRLATIRTW